MTHRIGLLTSLYDDYAVDLLRKFDAAIEDGSIPAEVSFVFCSRSKGSSQKVNERIATIEGLKNIKPLIILSAKDFQPELRVQDRDKWRLAYDHEVMKLLPAADSYLNVGYMQIIGSEMLGTFDIVNLHPALPWLGPTGMWPDVIEEQAKRPLPYLLATGQSDLEKALPEIMSISWNKAGGMLHLITDEPDRGPVISWYEFPLLSPALNELWIKATEILRNADFAKLKNSDTWQELVQKIRSEQFKGEDPLILLTYQKLARGEWIIKDRKLVIDEQVYPEGYCLKHDLAEFLESQGIENLIGKP